MTHRPSSRTTAATVAAKEARAAKLLEQARAKAPGDRTAQEQAAVDPGAFRDKLAELYAQHGTDAKVAEAVGLSRVGLRWLLKSLSERGFPLELKRRRGVGSQVSSTVTNK